MFYGTMTDLVCLSECHLSFSILSKMLKYCFTQTSYLLQNVRIELFSIKIAFLSLNYIKT